MPWREFTLLLAGVLIGAMAVLVPILFSDPPVRYWSESRGLNLCTDGQRTWPARGINGHYLCFMEDAPK